MLPPLAAMPTLLILGRWADPQVVGHLDYTILFQIGSVAWILASAGCMQLLGISVRDDALERNNPAALIALGGTMSGAGLIYALSNVGTGPTIWTTIVPALAATILLVLLWLMIEWIGGGVADAITIDRDVATALRLAGATVGCSIVLGSAASGNWIAWDRTWIELIVRSWPACVIAAVAGITQRIKQPTLWDPHPAVLTFGLIPGLAFLIVGILTVFIL